MDRSRFDDLARNAAAEPSRRTLLKVVAGSAGGGLLALFGARSRAQAKQPNDFRGDTCGDVSDHCEEAEDCCHGLVCSNKRCGCPPNTSACKNSCGNTCCAAGQGCVGGVCACSSNGFPACGGACCAPGQICSATPAGVMTCACPSGSALCNGHCVSTSSDNANCGSCGKVCPPGTACSGGGCVASCPSGESVCNGQCVNVSYDPQNCGGCGRVCPAGNVCSAGVCALSCQAGEANCSGTCRDLSSDNNNCGSCGHTCPAGSICASGVCSVTCAAPNVLCNGQCVNTASSAQNCGSCGHACGNGQSCCSGVCINTTSDPQNCGQCGVVCAPGTTCTNGQCVATVSCTNGVKDGQETDVDCGGPQCPPCINGKHCAQGHDCVSGVCCGGICIDASSDVNNCGACGNHCALPNATAVCISGICQVGTCNTGFVDCNRNPADGCEVNVLADPLNCGNCGNVCVAQNGTAVCTAGTCHVATCNPGFADCDGTAANGCETNVRTDVNNCGACGHRCGSSQICSNGACV